MVIWQSSKPKNSENSELKLKWHNQFNRFMNKCVCESKSLLEKQFNVNFTTHETERLSEKNRSSTSSHQEVAFKTTNVIKCLWVSPKTAKRSKSELSFNLYCIGVWNPRCQLVTNIRCYYKTGKIEVGLKKPCFAKRQKGCARPATKPLIY